MIGASLGFSSSTYGATPDSLVSAEVVLANGAAIGLTIPIQGFILGIESCWVEL
jgi:hypothetical protein